MRVKEKMKKIIVYLFLMVFLVGSVSATVTGLSEARITSNFLGFDKAWIIDFVSDDFTTDRINAFFTPSDFEAVSGNKAKQSLTISANTKPNSCQWSVKEDLSTKPDIIKYTPFTVSEWTTDIDGTRNKLSNVCAPIPGADFYWKSYSVFGSGKVEIWCVVNSGKLGTIGNFLSPFTLAETDWSVTASGKSTQSATISNGETGSGRSTRIGDNVIVQWQGLAGTGEQCPSTANSVPIHSNSFIGGWRVVTEGDYDSYRNYVDGVLSSDIANWGKGILPESIFKSSLSRAETAITKDFAFGSFTTLDSSVSNGKISVDLGRQIVFPQFRLIVDADYLELDIPSGKPQLSKGFGGKCSPNGQIEFTEGSAGRLNVEINNVGGGEGGFTTRVLSCTDGFSSNTPPQGSRLGAGDSQSLTFEIIGSTTSSQSTLSGSCTVEMKESLTQETDTCTFSTELTQIRECPPPEIACGVEGGVHVINECNTEGTGLEIKEVCESNEICKETITGAKCVVPTIPSDKCGFFNVVCHLKNVGGFFSGLFSGALSLLAILRGVVVGIVVIFSFLFGKDFFDKFGVVKKTPALGWIFAGLLAIGLGLLVNAAFVIGLIAFAGWIIFRLIVGNKLTQLKKGVKRLRNG